MRQTTSGSWADRLGAQARQLLGARLGDAWRRGDRLPPVRQLAQQLGISHGTVQRAVRDLIRQGFLISKPRLGIYVSDRFSDAQLRAVFAAHASASPTAERPLAGLRVAVVISADATHLAPAAQSLLSALIPMGCTVEQFAYGHGEAVQRVAYPEHQALILVNPDSTLQVDCGAQQHLLVMSVAATLPTIHKANFDLVSVDQDQAAALAGQYLRQRGCQDACFVGMGTRIMDQRPDFEPQGPPYRLTSQLRLLGFQRGWGASLPPQHLLYAGAYSPLSGSTVARLYAALQPRPRGVFVASDDLAVGFVTGLAALGLHAPRDYELVAFDGQAEFKQLVRDRAVSVITPAALMGMHAAQLLADRVRHPDRPRRTLLLGCRLPQADQA